MFHGARRLGNYRDGFAFPYHLNLLTRLNPFQHLGKVQADFRNCRCFQTLPACFTEERLSTFITFGAKRACGWGGLPHGVRFLLSALRFQLSGFSISALGFLLGFSMPYSTRSQSSNVRRVCLWREASSIRRRTVVSAVSRAAAVGSAIGRYSKRQGTGDPPLRQS
jgi:hypothetical protein